MEEEEGFKCRILKKLRSPLPQVGGYLTRPSRVLHLHHPPPPADIDGYGLPPPSPSPPPSTSRPCGPHHRPPQPAAPSPDPGRALRELPLSRSQDDREPQPGDQDRHQRCRRHPISKSPPDIVHLDELMRNVKDGEADDIWSGDGQENARPAPAPSAASKDTTPSLQDNSQAKPFSPEDDENTPPASPGQLDVSSSYRRPDLNLCSLFDPNLLAAFQQAVMEHTLACEELCRKAKSAPREEEEEGDLHRDQEEEEPPCKLPRTDNSNGDDDGEADPLGVFELRCPPGGRGAVVLYTTSLRGIRKTFEDCNSVRFLLCSLRVLCCERDVSMHLGYREELWHILGGRAVPPRLFIRGRYIGGADEVIGLHEQGQLLPLMRGLPVDHSGGVPCRWCGGARFVLCAECSGSRKVYEEEEGGAEAVRCPRCNENGLVVCTLCCWSSSCPASDQEFLTLPTVSSVVKETEG